MLKFLNTNYPELIKKIDTTNFNRRVIAIDISILLYQVIIAIRHSGADMINCNGDITSHILGLFNKTIYLMKMNIIPLYVFDGKPPELKHKVLQNRREVKLRALSKLTGNLSEEDKIKYFKRTVSISKKQIEECKELLSLMGIPYVEAPEEADSQCAYLVKTGIACGVLTEDMDILTFGANTIYKNLTSYKKDNLQIDLSDILQTLEINYEQFVELCILFGCDYNEHIRDSDPNLIYRYYKTHKNIETTISHMRSDMIKIADIPNYAIYKNYFLNPPINTITSEQVNLNKPDLEKLEKLLVSKYGLVKIKIIGKLNFLNSFYVQDNNCENLEQTY